MRINLLTLFHERVARDGVYKVADDLGCSHSSVYNWKDGKANPPYNILQALLDEHLDRPAAAPFDHNGGKTLILMPILRHVEGRTFATVTRAMAHYGRDQVDLLTTFRTDVDRARCILIDRAMETDAENFIMCDADAVVPCGYGPYVRELGHNIPDPNAGLNGIARLLSSPPEQRVVSALCYGRRLPMIAACASGVAGGSSAAELVRLKGVPGETGTEPQDWVGMHFCLIRRSVIVEMRQRAKELFPNIIPRVDGQPWGYFIKDNPGQSEDGAFSARCMKMGVQPFLDTTLRVGHVADAVL